MNTTVMNTILYCENWNETKDFYNLKLKLPVTESQSWFVEFEITRTSRLSIADARHTHMKSSRGLGHVLTFRVEDLSELRRTFRAAGLSPEPVRRHPWDARVMDLYDPEGNRLEFWAENS